MALHQSQLPDTVTVWYLLAHVLGI